MSTPAQKDLTKGQKASLIVAGVLTAALGAYSVKVTNDFNQAVEDMLLDIEQTTVALEEQSKQTCLELEYLIATVNESHSDSDEALVIPEKLTVACPNIQGPK